MGIRTVLKKRSRIQLQPSCQRLSVSGVSRLDEHQSDLFSALHISMVTRTDRAIVMGGDDSNTSQRMSAKSSLSSLHCMKWD